MKDATGELSMTAVAVVAIAAIGVVFSTLIWPTIKANIMRSTLCSQTITCDCPGGNDLCTCIACSNEDCSESQEVKCTQNDV